MPFFPISFPPVNDQPACSDFPAVSSAVPDNTMAPPPSFYPLSILHAPHLGPLNRRHRSSPGIRLFVVLRFSLSRNPDPSLFECVVSLGRTSLLYSSLPQSSWLGFWSFSGGLRGKQDVWPPLSFMRNFPLQQRRPGSPPPAHLTTRAACSPRHPRRASLLLAPALSPPPQTAPVSPQFQNDGGFPGPVRAERLWPSCSPRITFFSPSIGHAKVIFFPPRASPATVHLP